MIIIYKLTNECKGVKEENIIYNLKKKRLKSSIYAEENVDIVTYITNIPNDISKAEHIYDFYSLRWQIEIMFKCWKSIFNIDKNKNMKVERLRCGLIGTLLSIALANNIYNELKTSFYIETGESLSELKGFRMIKDYFSLLQPSLLKGKKFIKLTLSKIGQQLKKKCKKSRKKKQFMAEDKVKYAIV